MALNRHAVEQTQLRRQHRVDGVGRPKFDFHTGALVRRRPRRLRLRAVRRVQRGRRRLRVNPRPRARDPPRPGRGRRTEEQLGPRGLFARRVSHHSAGRSTAVSGRARGLVERAARLGLAHRRRPGVARRKALFLRGIRVREWRREKRLQGLRGADGISHLETGRVRAPPSDERHRDDATARVLFRIRAPLPLGQRLCEKSTSECGVEI